jgi:lipoyl(octanoyl) transferase
VRHLPRSCHTAGRVNGRKGPACYRAAVEATLIGPAGGALSEVAPGRLETHWLGRIEYGRAWSLQKRLAAARADDLIADQLLLLEHPAVLTLGRTSDPAHILASTEELATRGIDVIRVERGGEVTYHGPGQLVAYPVLALNRRGLLVRPLVRALEDAMIATCRALGVEAGRREGHPGCWVDPEGPIPRKIGALGLRVERGVSYHGIALNVSVELAEYELIDACGMPGVVSTSIAAERGSTEAPSTASVAGAARLFAAALGAGLGIHDGAALPDVLPDPRLAIAAVERTLVAAGA